MSSLIEAFERWCLDTKELHSVDSVVVANPFQIRRLNSPQGSNSGSCPSKNGNSKLKSPEFSESEVSEANADFSGFSDVGSVVNGSCGEAGLALSILTDVSQRLAEIREVMSVNRQLSRDRQLSTISERRASWRTEPEVVTTGVMPVESVTSIVSSVGVSRVSPPVLRSRGPVLDLPHVMSTPLEYRKDL